MLRIRRLAGKACGAALLLAALAASGCGSESAPDSEGNPEITLTYMHMGVASESEDSNPYVMRHFPDAVEERFPGIRLETEMLPEDPYTKTLLVQLSSGEGPDFFEWWPMRQLEELVRAGYLHDLTDTELLRGFSRDALAGFTVDGRVYGVPKGLSIMATWYNRDLLERHGYDTFPADWPSFLQMCETLKQAGVTPIVMPDEDRWFIQFGLYQLAATLVYADDPDFDKRLLAGERTFSGSAWREALVRYKTLYDQGYVVGGSLDIGGTQAAALFNEGKAAMMFNGNWDYARMTSGSPDSFRRGFMPLPGNDPGRPLLLSVGPAGGTVINKNTGHLEEVLDILAYQLEPSSPLNRQY